MHQAPAHARASARPTRATRRRAPGLPARRAEDLRQRDHRARRARPRRPAGRVRLPPRPFRLRQVHRAAHHGGPRRADRRRGRVAGVAGRRGPPGRDRLRVPGADPDALGERRRQRLAAAAPARRLPPRGRAARSGRPRPRRPGRLRARLSARALGRHEDARLHRPRPVAQAEAPPHGRAFRGARRDHPLQAQRRPLARFSTRSAARWSSSPTRSTRASTCRAASW